LDLTSYLKICGDLESNNSSYLNQNLIRLEPERLEALRGVTKALCWHATNQSFHSLIGHSASKVSQLIHTTTYNSEMHRRKG